MKKTKCRVVKKLLKLEKLKAKKKRIINNN